MSLASSPFAARPKEHQFVGDLESLFRRLRVPIGTPECLETFASRLESNSGLRSDLFTLSNAISRMSEADLSPEELLGLIARAVGGPAVLSEADGEPVIPEPLKAAFLPAFREWQTRTESLSSIDWSEPLPAPQPAERLARFAAAASQKPLRRATDRNRSKVEQPADISPGTPIGELTIAQLRDYLDDIEQRVGRLQPYLHSLRPELPPAETALPSEDPPYLGEAEVTTAKPVLEIESSGPFPDSISPEEQPNSVVPATLSAPELLTPSMEENMQDDNEEEDEKEQEVTQNFAPVEPLPDEPVLTLRGGSTLDPSEQTLFRSVSDPPARRSPALLGIAAALLVLAPAAYYGKKYIAAPAAVLRISTPPPPASPAPDLSLPPNATAAAASPVTHQTSPRVKPRTPYTPRLEPHAVHMAAEAARAQNQDSGGIAR